MEINFSDNYRGITLSTVISKIFEIVLFATVEHNNVQYHAVVKVRGPEPPCSGLSPPAVNEKVLFYA